MQRPCVAAAGIRHVTLGRIHLQGRPLVSGREEGEDSQVHEEEERKKLQQEDQGKQQLFHATEVITFLCLICDHDSN